MTKRLWTLPPSRDLFDRDAPWADTAAAARAATGGCDTAGDSVFGLSAAPTDLGRTSVNLMEMYE